MCVLESLPGGRGVKAGDQLLKLLQYPMGFVPNPIGSIRSGDSICLYEFMKPAGRCSDDQEPRFIFASNIISSDGQNRAFLYGILHKSIK